MTSHVYISIGAATAHCAIGVSGISGTIINETEKAVQVQAYTAKDKAVTAWFPRKALVSKQVRGEGNGKHVAYKLAKWFVPTGWTRDFIAITVQHSTISA